MAATPATKQDKAPAKARTTSIEMRPTNLPHTFLIDWNDDGILKEIAVVMVDPQGSIYGIEIEKMHNIDKARLKKFLISVHADKYPLWELLAQGRLNNGCSALDFMHSNYVKVKRPLGAVLGGGLASVEVYNDSRMIGEEFSNPASATLANEMPSAFS